jgi:hypothetical protein
MTFVPALDQLQLGTEDFSAWGTPVDATVQLGLISDATIEPEVGIETLADVRGSIAPGYVAVLNSHRGGASVAGVCTYEDLPYWFESLLGEANLTGSDPYTRAYVGQLDPTALTPNLTVRRLYTLVLGQASKVQRLTGAIVNEFSIKMESNKPWTFTAKLIGKDVADGTIQDLAAALLTRGQTPIHANSTQLFIDNITTDHLGDNEITSLWFSAELNIKNVAGLVNGMGSLTPKAYTDAQVEATLKLKADVNADSDALLADIIGTAVAQRKVRLSASSGANVVTLDFAGTFSSAPKIDSDQDGVSALEFEMDAIYNIHDMANWFNASVINHIDVLD